MSQRITIEELRRVTQPDSVRGRANSEHWVADLYLRRISPYLTRILLKCGFTPNAVTWLMIITGVSAGFSLLIPGFTGILLALLLGQLQMLWDCCDGEIARWKKKFSPAGIFLDKLGHYLTEATLAVCLGLRLAQWPEKSDVDSKYLLIGVLLALFIVLNKVLNDAVHVSRYFAGLPKLEDSKAANYSEITLISFAKKIFTFIPIHRIFHSVEMTIIVFFLTLVGELTKTSILENIFNWAIPAILFVFIGHLVSILTSTKLRSPE